MLPPWANLAWTTAVLPEAEALESWRSVSWEAFSPVAVEAIAPGFGAALVAGALGALGLARIRAAAQRVRREEQHVRAGDPGTFFLNLSLTGASSATQDGRTARLGPGDLTVVDSARPFSLDFRREFDQISLFLPKELLLPRLRDPEAATAVAVRGDAGVGAVASAAIRGLERGGGARPHELRDRAVSDHVLDLVALALEEAVDEDGREPTLLERLQAEAERLLGEPDLAPADVAARVGVSPRYLHKLFAASGTSFGRWVLARRLERGRAALLAPGAMEQTIAEVALEQGFRDPSHFARAFRSRYRATPAQVRAQGALVLAAVR